MKEPVSLDLFPVDVLPPFDSAQALSVSLACLASRRRRSRFLHWLWLFGSTSRNHLLRIFLADLGGLGGVW